MRIKFRQEKSFGLIGNPLGHSLSPFIHKELFKIAGISADYELYEADENELVLLYKNTLSALTGFNVTIPHKQNIIPLLDSLSGRARLFGSVNTVYNDGEKATGYNTDCIGFLRSLEGAGIELEGSVLILGCGGVARTFAFESVIAGAEVTLAVRRTGFEKATKLKNEIKEKLNSDVKIAFLDKIDSGYDLIINATPVGMFPKTDASPLEKEAVLKSKAVFDAIYNPQETLLIKYAKEGGLKYLNGLPMLVWQAAAAEEIWNGVKFTEQEVERVIELTRKELEKG